MSESENKLLNWRSYKSRCDSQTQPRNTKAEEWLYEFFYDKVELSAAYMSENVWSAGAHNNSSSYESSNVSDDRRMAGIGKKSHMFWICL